MNNATFRQVMRRLDLCDTLMQLRLRLGRAKQAQQVALEVSLRQRQAAIRRELAGRGEPQDIFMDARVGAEVLRETVESAKDLPEAQRYAVASYALDILEGMEALARAESRLDPDAGQPPSTAAVRDAIFSVMGSPAGAAPDAVIDEWVEAGRFDPSTREGIVAALRSPEPPELAEQLKQLEAQYDLAEAERLKRYEQLVSSVRALSPDAQEERVRRYREYEQWFAQTYRPVVQARSDVAVKAAAEKAARRTAAGAQVIDSVMAASPVTADAATKWASLQTITRAAQTRLKRLGYALESVRSDMADFYRLTGGRLTTVVIDSKGGGRANATDISAVGKPGRINMGARFDRRVLWHELAHHLEADPVARTAASRFIRRRSTDGRLHSLSALTGMGGYRRSEVAFKGDFFHPYVGKRYTDGYTEVFAMGVETFSDPDLLTTRAATDPQTLEFVLGFIRQPMTPLARAHAGMRTLLLEASRDSGAAVDDALGQARTALAALAGFVKDTDKSWAAAAGLDWFTYRLDQVGRFTDTPYHLFKGKVRNRATGRKGAGYLVIWPSGERSMSHVEFAGMNLMEPLASVGYWRKMGKLGTFELNNLESLQKALAA